MTANKVTKVTGIGTIIVGAICGPMVAQLGWSGAAAIECLQVLAELANAIAQAAGSD